jgi:PAS domain S-box-containing protein
MTRPPPDSGCRQTPSSSDTLVQQHIPHPYQSLDRDGTILDVNEAWLAELQYDRGDVIGEWFGDFLAPGHTQQFRTAFPQFKADGRVSDIEFEMTRADGSAVWVSFDGRIEYDDTGSVVRTHCQFSTITERKERNAKLQRFQRAIEAAGHAVYITDTEGVITYVNPAFEAITGYDEAETLGQTPRILHSGEMPADHYEELWDTILDGDVWAEEVINRRSDGELYTAHQTIAPVTTEDGEIQAFVAIQTDVTAQKQQRQQLERYKQAIESSTEQIAAIGPDYTYLFANRQYREFFGFESADDITTKHLRDVIGERNFGDTQPYVEQAFQGSIVKYETSRLGAGDAEQTLEIRYYPLEDEADAIQGVMAVIRDITARQNRLEAIHRLSEYRRISSTVNRTLVRAATARDLLPRAAQIIATSSLFECTFLTLLDGSDVEFACGAESELDDPDVAQFHTPAYVDAVLEDGVLELEDVTSPPFEQHTGTRPSHPGLGLAISHDQQPFGVLTVHFGPGEAIEENDIRLLRDLADDIGLFLHSQQLEENLRTFKEIADRIDDPIMLQDRDGTFQVVNDAVAAFAETPKAELIGRDEFAFMDEESATLVQEMKQRAIAEARPVEYQVSPTGPGQQTRSFSTRRYPHYDSSGSIDGTVAICRDVTALEERGRHIRVIDRVLRHNLRNDMNLIRGYAQMIQRSISDDVAAYAEQILSTSRDLLETADKERMLSSFLADPPPSRRLDLVPVLVDTAGTIRSRHPDVDLAVSHPDSCDVVVAGPIGRVLEEVLENAVVHSETDAPSIEVSVSREQELVRISVADNGPGIPEMERNVLAGNRQIDPLCHGSGLGLWFVHHVVRESGGSMQFAELAPSGTEITIELPAGS